jgi:hypothetical protein
MTSTAPGEPSMAAIGKSQNTEANLRLQVAARHFYRLGKLLQFAGTSVNLFLALVSPFVLLFEPTWGPALGAIAGAWLFLSRQVLVRFKRTFQTQGATAQELFDCAVLGLDWNDALVRRISDEEISGASRKLHDVDQLRDWYPTAGAQTWPASVLICQRANAVWARRQHRAYAYVLRCSAVVWGLIGIVVAIVHGTTMADYLVTVALPSLPAVLDASELAERHLGSAKSREVLEEQADALLRNENATNHILREFQDQLFSLRNDSPIVPGWFYRLVRSKYEEDMKYAATQHAMLRDGGSGGQSDGAT